MALTPDNLKEILNTARDIHKETYENLTDFKNAMIQGGDNRTHSIDEMATSAEETRRQSIQINRMNIQLEKLATVIREIETGKYTGKCLNKTCNVDIPFERLQASPEARLCIECCGLLKG